MTADVVIAGAGLAGACAAAALAPTRRVVVLSDGIPGASHAAAGLVNPFLGRKAKRAWRAVGALDTLRAMTDEAGASDLWRPGGLLRPARDEKQSEVFQQRQSEHTDRLDWLTSEAAGERYPGVAAPHGALWVREGGHIEIPKLVHALLRAAEREGATVLRQRLTGWDRSRAITTDSILPYKHLLLCTGAGTRELMPSLPLHAVKGQTIRVRTPEPLASPPVSGGTYVVPVSDHQAVVGATFEHTFETVAPTPEASALLLERASGVLPTLAGAEVLEARAGLRMTLPAAVRPGRLPLVGPVPAPDADPGAPEAPAEWVFAGLGAKGLLTAPLLASHLPLWLDAPEAVWPEVSTLGLRSDAGSDARRSG